MPFFEDGGKAVIVSLLWVCGGLFFLGVIVLIAIPLILLGKYFFREMGSNAGATTVHLDLATARKILQNSPVTPLLFRVQRYLKYVWLAGLGLMIVLVVHALLFDS